MNKFMISEVVLIDWPLNWTGAEVTKFMLNSAEHDILNAHKYTIIKKNIFLLGSDNPRMLFSLLIDAKMPTILFLSTQMIALVKIDFEHGIKCSRKMICLRKYENYVL